MSTLSRATSYSSSTGISSRLPNGQYITGRIVVPICDHATVLTYKYEVRKRQIFFDPTARVARFT